jgi:hypothetical protein
MPLCEYGCGREATIQFKNGKWACCKNAFNCPTFIRCGKKNHMFGKKHSEETKKNLSKIQKELKIWLGKKHSEETKEKIKNALKGRSLSTEHKQRLSIAAKNRIVSEETKAKIAIASTGRKHNEETKQKLRDFHTGRRPNAETRRKLSIAKKARGITQETRRKMRLSLIKRIEKLHGKCFPNFNPAACALLDEYGKQYRYNIKHAMNGGEHYFKELGFWVDGYDIEKNTVFEVDEAHHFDADGNLYKKDIERQKVIIEHTECTFIRLKI